IRAGQRSVCAGTDTRCASDRCSMHLSFHGKRTGRLLSHDAPCSLFRWCLGLLGGTDLEDLGTTRRADPLGGRTTILHGHFLRILDLPLGLALHAISIDSHYAVTSL